MLAARIAEISELLYPYIWFCLTIYSDMQHMPLNTNASSETGVKLNPNNLVKTGQKRAFDAYVLRVDSDKPWGWFLIYPQRR